MTTSINSSSSTVDDSYKYVETASDLNVEGVEFYLGEIVDETLGAPIYKDKEHTQLATVDELVHFYNTNDLILVGETPTDSVPVRSRVNVIMDKSEGNAKICVLFYHFPGGDNGEITLISKYSIVAEEEIEEENNENENNENENEDELV